MGTKLNKELVQNLVTRGDYLLNKHLKNQLNACRVTRVSCARSCLTVPFLRSIYNTAAHCFTSSSFPLRARCVCFLRFAKRRIIQNEVSKLTRVALVVAVNFFLPRRSILDRSCSSKFPCPTLIAFPNTAFHPVWSDLHIFCVSQPLHSNRNETTHERLSARA